MSYDLYLYKSKIGIPDQEEADAVIEADNDKWAKKERDLITKLAIVKALTTYNPKLQAFDFHYGEIAKLTVEAIVDGGRKFDHIEINHPDGDISLQVIVYDNHVFLTVPYWYRGPQAEQLFEYIKAYIKIIRETAGYFVSDPQTGEIFDPAVIEFDGLKKYLLVSENLDEIIKGEK